MNVLFIIADQWRHECLSCAGHPVLKTPNLDALAEDGVRFTQAVVQSPVCGPSRASFHTGRYPQAHRSSFNGVPLSNDEKGFGDYFAAAGFDPILVGKGLGVKGDCGLIPYQGKSYKQALLDRGYCSDDPVEDFATSVQTPEGKVISAWDFEALPYPLRVRAEDSPPAFVTDQAIECLRAQGGRPFAMHLSYVYPHWPLGAPAPYHNMYDLDQIPAPVRHPSELSAHPLLAPFRAERRALPMDNEWVWRHARATYYGMMSLVDAQLGRLFCEMKLLNLWEDTLIIFTSDHGEYLGDHYMFEKELFYDQAVRVPLIVRHPGLNRGLVCGAPVESVDILPTCLNACDLPVPVGVQGKPLQALLSGDLPEDWRADAFCDWDFEFYHVREKLDVPPHRARGMMLRTEEFKYIHYNGLPGQLFDLKKDPDELVNVIDRTEYAKALSQMRARLLTRAMDQIDRTYSQAYYDRVGGIGVTLASDRTANYGRWDREYPH